MSEDTSLINVRVPSALLRRIEMELSARHQRGLMLTKSDLVREALDRLLPVEPQQDPELQAS